MKSIIAIMLLLLAGPMLAAPAPREGQGQGIGQQLRALNAQIREVSANIDFPAASRETVEESIRNYQESSQRAFNSYARRGVDQKTWERVGARMEKEGGKLKKELKKHVGESEHEEIDELVALMNRSFILRQQIAMFQQRAQRANQED